MYFSWMIEMHYSIDTYHTMYMGWSEAQLDMIQRNGRPFTAIVYKLYDILNLSIYEAYIQQVAIFYIFTTLSISLMYKIFWRQVNKQSEQSDKTEIKIVLFMICVLTIINTCIAKLVVFIECGCMLFAVYCCVLASNIQIKNGFRLKVEQKNIIKCVLTIALLLVQLCIYQITAALFVLICCIYIINDSDESKQDKIRNIACTLIYYGISCILYLLILKLTYTGRPDVDQNYSIVVNIFYIICYNLLKLKQLNNLLPYRLEAVWLTLIAILNAYNYSCSKHKSILIGLARALVLIVVSMFICYDFIIFGEGCLIPRIEYVFYCTDGLLLLDIILKSKQDNISKNMTVIISTMMLVCNLILVQDIQVDIFKMNEANLTRANAIVARIHDYERETGIKVDSIATYMDMHSDYIDSIGIKGWQDDMFDMEVKPDYQAEIGSNNVVINQTVGTSYRLAERDPDIENYFSQNDWTEPSDELYIFKDNVLHVCAY